MSFEEFMAACATAQVVTTMDGPAILLGTTVVQFKGSDVNWAAAFVDALRLAKLPEKTEQSVEPVAPV